MSLCIVLNSHIGPVYTVKAKSFAGTPALCFFKVGPMLLAHATAFGQSFDIKPRPHEFPTFCFDFSFRLVKKVKNWRHKFDKTAAAPH